MKLLYLHCPCQYALGFICSLRHGESPSKFSHPINHQDTSVGTHFKSRHKKKNKKKLFYCCQSKENLKLALIYTSAQLKSYENPRVSASRHSSLTGAFKPSHPQQSDTLAYIHRNVLRGTSSLISHKPLAPS